MRGVNVHGHTQTQVHKSTGISERFTLRTKKEATESQNSTALEWAQGKAGHCKQKQLKLH